MNDWAKQRLAELGAAAPRRGKADLFIRVPLKRAEEVCKTAGPQATVVWTLLLYMAWRAKSSRFACPNGLMRQFGICRQTKYRALEKLEAAGIIAVDRPPRRSPIVTLLGA